MLSTHRCQPYYTPLCRFRLRPDEAPLRELRIWKYIIFDRPSGATAMAQVEALPPQEVKTLMDGGAPYLDVRLAWF